MKIKTDFVTNSSSTSYIVFIPKDFIVKRKHITKKVREYDFDDLLDETNEDWDKILDEINKLLDNLKTGHTIWADYEETELDNRQVFYALQQILEDQGYQLESYESGSEDGKIHNIGVHHKQIAELLLAEMLTKITVKGVTTDDVTEDKQ